jgi:outer membrane cobalamin receptor
MHRLAVSFSISIFIVLACATSAFADVLTGIVRDPKDQPVKHARVLVMNGTVVVTTATTANDGKFGPVTLPVGEFDVLVAADGLRAPAKHVTIAATGTVDIEIKMAVAAVNESVSVSSSAVDRALSRVTDSVAIIDRADLDARQTETATDMLRTVPGFSLVQNGGRGALMSIFPRGGESDYTMVLFDGMPLNAFGGGFDGAHLQTAGVDRIEVVRGPQSAVYGSGAIGGVVNVITRAGGPLAASALVEGGSQATSRVTGSASGSHGAWFWGSAFESLNTNGDTSFRDSIGGPVSNDDYQRLAFSGTGGWSDRATRRFVVNTRFTHDERGNPGPYGSDPFGLYSGLDTISRGTNDGRAVGGSAVLGDTAHFRHTVTGVWTDAPSTFVSPFGEANDETRRLIGRYQIDFERRVAGFSAGADLTHERADNTFVTDPTFTPIPVARNLAGFFGEMRWTPDARASVTAGLRVDRIERNSLEGDAFGSRPAFDDNIVWSVNPKVSAAWYLAGSPSTDPAKGWTKIRGGAGTGIKPPTVFEIAFTDNPALKPERSRSMDLGVEQAFAGLGVVADVTYFANRFDDLIVAVGTSYSGASRYQTDNIANASAKGVELGAHWQSHFGVSVRGAFTWLDTEVLGIDNFATAAPPPYAVGDPLVRRPRHQGSLDVRYARNWLQLYLAVNGRGDMSDLEPNFASTTLTNPGYVVADFGGSVRIAAGLEAYARVTNLADRSYEDALGYPAPGRLAMVGLRVAIGR